MTLEILRANAIRRSCFFVRRPSTCISEIKESRSWNDRILQYFTRILALRLITLRNIQRLFYHKIELYNSIYT